MEDCRAFAETTFILGLERGDGAASGGYLSL